MIPTGTAQLDSIDKLYMVLTALLAILAYLERWYNAYKKGKELVVAKEVTATIVGGVDNMPSGLRQEAEKSIKNFSEGRGTEKIVKPVVKQIKTTGMLKAFKNGDSDDS